jgi:hypothetical protein
MISSPQNRDRLWDPPSGYQWVTEVFSPEVNLPGHIVQSSLTRRCQKSEAIPVTGRGGL